MSNGEDGMGFGDNDFLFEVPPEIDYKLSQEVPEGAPEPTLWRLLIMPLVPKKVTDGGIILTSDTQKNQSMINYIGRVAKIGSLAFKSNNTKDEQNPPEVGDYVIFGRYAGVRIMFKGVPMVIVADDDIIAKTEDPTGFKVYV